MNRNIRISITTISIFFIMFVLSGCSWSASMFGNNNQITDTQPTQDTPTEIKPVEHSKTKETEAKNSSAVKKTSVKEIAMDSYTEVKNGQYLPRFSLKEVSVKKGDRVKFNIYVKSGNHDFAIDEFAIHAHTPTGEITTVEFVADKAGEFVFYCHKPGHRAKGQWGVLKVTE